MNRTSSQIVSARRSRSHTVWFCLLLLYWMDSSFTNVNGLVGAEAPGLTVCQERLEIAEPTSDQSLVLFFRQTIQSQPVSVICLASNVGDSRLYIEFNQTSTEAPVGSSTATVFYDVAAVGGEANVTCSARSAPPGDQYTGESVTVVFSTRAATMRIFPSSFALHRPGSEVRASLVLSYLPMVEVNVTAACGIVTASSTVGMSTGQICSMILNADVTATTALPAAATAMPAPGTPGPGTPVVAATTGPATAFTASSPTAAAATPTNQTTDSRVGVSINGGNRSTARLSFPSTSRSASFDLIANGTEATEARSAHLALICCSPTCWNCTLSRFNDTFARAEVLVDIAASYNASMLADRIADVPSAAGCTCDLTAGVCNFPCCCDPDCTSQDRLLMSTCTATSPTVAAAGAASPAMVQSCSSAGASEWSDWNNVLCVHKDNNPDDGMAFTSTAVANSSTAFQLLRDTAAQSTAYSGATAGRLDQSSSNGYRQGDTLLAATSSATQSVVVALPESSGIGCFETAPLQFLVDRQTSCSRLVTESACSTSSNIDARNYLTHGLATVQPSTGQCWRAPGILASPADGAATAASCAGTVACTDADRVRPVQYLADTTQAILAALGQPEVANTSAPAACQFPASGGPPQPTFNPATNTCDNALLALAYNIQWRANQVISVATVLTLGSVQVGRHVQQSFQVQYQAVPAPAEAACSSATEVQALSGNPGYQAGHPLRLGQLDAASGTTASIVPATLGLLAWNSGNAQSSLCTEATQEELLFGRSQASGCLLRISLDDIQANCESLRGQALALQESLITASHVAKTGSTPHSTTDGWVEILQSSVDLNGTTTTTTTLLPTTRPSSANTTRNSTGSNTTQPYQLKGTCARVPSKLAVTVLYASVGRDTNLRPRHQIMAVSVNITAEDWNFPCSSAACNGGTSDNRTHLFEISSTVQFIQVPSNPTTVAKSDAHIWQQDTCRHSTCSEHFFYPLTPFFWSLLADQDKWFTIATTLLAVSGGLAVLMLNTRWRPPATSHPR